MKENKQMKISLGTAICIFLIIILVIALVGMYFYCNKSKENLEDQIVTSEAIDETTSNNPISKNNNKIELELGKYTIVECEIDDETGILNDWCGVELKDNDKFIIEMPNGEHRGTYKVENNTLICKSTLYVIEREQEHTTIKTDVVFNFNIIELDKNENDSANYKLELKEVEINDAKNNKEELLSGKAFKEGNTFILLPINRTIAKLANNLKGTTWNSKTAYIKDVNGNLEETTLYTVLGKNFASIGESYLKLNADGTYYNAIFPTVENEKSRNGTWKVLGIDEAPNEDNMTTIEIALSSGEYISIRYTKDLEIKQLDYGVEDGQNYDSKIVLEKE